MLLHDGTQLTEDQIEELNANGPYSMAVWKSGEVSVGNEEGLAGRSEYFLNLIRESILKNYTLEELKNMSILDIGCNDGWVLHQLSDLPFAKMVGIEPREKNISKGRTVREVLKLSNSVDYFVGDIESLEGESFDIVICTGVLYHVESIPVALNKIRNSCKSMVFIESRCISSRYITSELKEEIEMRDLVYQFKEEICGITAQKYESAYHDGSTSHTTIVNVPSTETLVMHLRVLGFNDIEVVADTKKYREDVWKDKRPLGGVCITAKLSDESKTLESEEDYWIEQYEEGLKNEILPRSYLEPLYKVFCLQEPISELSGCSRKTYDYLTSSSDLLSIENDLLPNECKNKYATEIVKNLRYSPSDKIALEYGKLEFFEENLDNALKVLRKIISNLNADWRSAYRAFNLISKIYNRQDNPSMEKKYRTLCLTANPKYKID